MCVGVCLCACVISLSLLHELLIARQFFPAPSSSSHSPSPSLAPLRQARDEQRWRERGREKMRGKISFSGFSCSSVGAVSSPSRTLAPDTGSRVLGFRSEGSSFPLSLASHFDRPSHLFPLRRLLRVSLSLSLSLCLCLAFERRREGSERNPVA